MKSNCFFSRLKIVLLKIFIRTNFCNFVLYNYIYVVNFLLVTPLDYSTIMANTSKIKDLLSDLGRSTKRGVKKCPSCGTHNGTRTVVCKTCYLLLKPNKKVTSSEVCRLLTSTSSQVCFLLKLLLFIIYNILHINVFRFSHTYHLKILISMIEGLSIFQT